jgi:hypothetical protein
MTLEEFEAATEQELRQKADECFAKSENAGTGDKPYLYLEAQFYINEIQRREHERERRKDSRISTRDFWMECGVLLMILIEIILSLYGIRLSTKQGRDADALMTAQNSVLQNLNTSSAATARTLQSLQSTTEGMNDNIVTQLALNYLIPLTFAYDRAAVRLLATNGGLPQIKVWGFQPGSGDTTRLEKSPKVIETGHTASWPLKPVYDDVSMHTPNGSSVRIPVSFYVENAVQQRFSIHGTILATRHGHQVEMTINTTGIVPGWTNVY